MKKELCVPCAEAMKATKDVKLTAHRKQKITCAGCGRRRYGSEYEVTAKAKAGKEADNGRKQKAKKETTDAALEA